VDYNSSARPRVPRRKICIPALCSPTPRKPPSPSNGCVSFQRTTGESGRGLLCSDEERIPLQEACPGGSDRTQEQSKTTSLGYRTFRCPAGKRRFTVRIGTPFTDLSVPTAIVFLLVLWRLRYTLSLRDRAAMFLPRGCVFSHQAGRPGAALVAPLLSAPLRGHVGKRWHADET
jgi:hypothetical protein